MAAESKTATAIEQRLFNVQDAVTYLRSIGAASVTVSFVRTIIANGEVPHIKIGKRFFVTRTAMDEWLSRHERRTR